MVKARRVAVPALLLPLTVLGACADDATRESSPSATSALSSPSASSADAGGANTAEVVTAANTFLATLSDE